MVNFLPESLDPSDIHMQLHIEKLWADIFWRRRKSHERRVDPEIKYLARYPEDDFSKVLEIGAGYGRVSVKLSELQQVKSVTGIEICHHFGEYSKIYTEGHDKITFIFDDFMSTTFLHPNEFDLIVLPMNTLPSLPVNQMNHLFDKIRQMLKPGGKFIFTTYPERNTKQSEENYYGELLVELGEDPIAAEYFTMKDSVMPWGIRSMTYAKFRYLSEKPEKDVTRYFRLKRNFIHHNYLSNLLRDNHFHVRNKEFVDHSMVFECEIFDESQ